jgi:hypothetical protein
MTPEIFIWALFTGGITGAVWMGIVLLSRQRRLAAEHRELLEDRQRVLDELEVLSDRVNEMQGRLDFAERHLASLGDPRVLAPPREDSGR